MKTLKQISLGSAVFALVAVPVAPVTAADINVVSTHDFSSVDDKTPIWTEDNSDGRRRRHRRGRVSAGDIFTGIAILGGIAIIADAASKSNKRTRNDYPPQNVPQQNFPQQNFPQQNFPQQNDQNGFGGNDIGSAVNICSNAAVQSAGNQYQVNQIRSVTRDGQGWRVEGNLIGPDSAGFSCGVSNGNVQFIQLN